MSYKRLNSKLVLSAIGLTLIVAACSPVSAGTQSGSAATSAPAAVSTSILSTQSSSLPVTGQDISQTVAAAKLNLNTASAADFLTIPGVADRMVREFQEYKPYTSILQFRKEIGKYVSTDQVAAYEKYVYVPIAVNTADAATLQQIPGLDASEAQALIAARPYASNDAFLTKLTAYVSADELALAKTYLSAQ